jgi:predicted permease
MQLFNYVAETVFTKDIIILTVGSVITVMCFLIGYLCVSSLAKYGNTVSDQGSVIVSKDRLN